jgi:RsiW-degrading membrane proteinase PrsW (M82 family)
MSVPVGIVLSLIFGITPMAILAFILTLFDRYEKEPAWLVIGVFLWGFVVAAGTALILNTIFGIGVALVLGSQVADVGAAIFSAPLVEESVKGLAVLIVFLFFHDEFDDVLDGVIYGSMVGFGFAAAENVNYIFTGFLQNGSQGLVTLVVVRVLLIPFLHATLTSMTGVGLAVGRLNKGFLRYGAPVAGYLVAIGLHFTHNLIASVPDPLVCILGDVIDWIGFVGMFVFILILVWREGKVMREHLAEEVALGNMSQAQYETAGSITGQIAARWGALFGGHWREASRFYDLAGDLAFKKYQLAKLGPQLEPQAQAQIERLRSQIASLRGSA